MSIDILKEDLKNNKIRNLYLFHGPEEYLKKYYLENIRKKILNEDLIVLNMVVLEDKVEAKSIMDNCEMLPAFSKKKMIIVKNSGLLKPKKKMEDAEGRNAAQNDELLSYLQNVPEHACLIFYETEIDKRSKILDIIRKKGLEVEFAFQKPFELVKWAAKVFNSYKKEIDSMTVSRLVENSEQGMNEILNEIKKVVLFTGDRVRVSDDDIDRVCTRSVKSRIFDLTDAVAEKNSVKALKLLDDMVILKEPVPRILFMITRQFRHVLEMKLLNEEGIVPGEAARKLGITPYAAGKILKQANSFTVDSLKQAIEESLELDAAIKTGRINDRIGTELLIVKFSIKL